MSATRGWDVAVPRAWAVWRASDGFCCCGLALLLRSAKDGSSSSGGAVPGISATRGGCDGSFRMRCGRGSPPKQRIFGSLYFGSSSRLCCGCRAAAGVAHTLKALC